MKNQIRTRIRIGIKTESLIRIHIRIAIKQKKAGPDVKNIMDPQYIMNPDGQRWGRIQWIRNKLAFWIRIQKF
jgi:hypothetical protein